MPIKEKTVVDLREEMALMALDDRFTVSEVAEQFGVSRPVVRLWRDRFHSGGREALRDRSHAPHGCPHKTFAEIEERIVAEYHACRFGAKKVRQRLIDRDPDTAWPSQSTFDAIFVRRGLSTPARRRRRMVTPRAFVYTFPASKPGELFTMDYKGQFRLGTREYCYPITLMDRVSSFLLRCEGKRDITFTTTWSAIERVLREYGCPLAAQADNGTPFGVPQGGISKISVELMKRDVQPVFSRPGKPQDNGRHERMHRELKAATARPPAANFLQQQRRFLTFQHDYNFERPHEGIGMRRPADLFFGGVKPYPTRLRSPEYCASWETRKVNGVGQIKWCGKDLFVGAALAGETVALQPVADALSIVYYYRFTIGKIDEQSMTFL